MQTNVLTIDRLTLEMIVKFDVGVECRPTIGARHKSLARVRPHVLSHFEAFGELLLAVQPMALHSLVPIVLLVRLNLVDAVAAHMIEIVLNQIKGVATVLPLAQIPVRIGIANHIPSPRIVHACGQRFLLQQQLFAQRFQIRHVHVKEHVTLEHGQLIRFIHTKIPITFVRMPFVGQLFDALEMPYHVRLQFGIGVDELVALLPFACKINFRLFHIRWQWMLWKMVINEMLSSLATPFVCSTYQCRLTQSKHTQFILVGRCVRFEGVDRLPLGFSLFSFLLCQPLLAAFDFLSIDFICGNFRCGFLFYRRLRRFPNAVPCSHHFR